MRTFFCTGLPLILNIADGIDGGSGCTVCLTPATGISGMSVSAAGNCGDLKATRVEHRGLEDCHTSG